MSVLSDQIRPKYVRTEIYQQPLASRKSGAMRMDYGNLQTPPGYNIGIYILMTQCSDKRHMPWYVGKTVDQNFGDRFSQDDSMLKADDILQEKAWKPSRHPKMFIAFIDGTKMSRDEIDGLESLLIKDAKRMNPSLLNKKKTSDKHRGITHTCVGIIGFRNGELKGVLNQGTEKQKRDGEMLWRTLGHGDQ
jgi:hypothetical protein|tara:strand:- start:183 stop:755 length:573 start_codon:yes stop_codon:yes gene_type:complete